MVFEFLIADAEPVDGQTKLHRNTADILNDRTTLTFFVQYLESKNGHSLVKFWLDLEAFKAVRHGSTPMRLDSHCSKYDSSKSKLKRTESTSDCVSISTTSCSESNVDENEEVQPDEVDHARVAEPSYDLERMTQSLTDDEKSKICEKKRKKDEVEVEADEVKPEDKPRKIEPTVLDDALGIYRKYLVTDSLYSIELPATILSKLSLALCETESSDCDIDSNNLWEAFEEAQKHVFDVLEKEFLADFLDSSFYCKYTVEILTDPSLNLREILYSESALFYFMEFLEQEKDCKLPYLEFWLSATSLRKQSDHKQMQEDAVVIYDKWFSLQATSPLNFSNRVRTKVEERICSMDLLAQSFDEAIR